MGRKTARWLAALAVVAGAVGSALVAAAAPAAAATVPPVIVINKLTPFNSDDKTFQVDCPVGKRIVGGGAFITGSDRVVLTELRPITGAVDGYRVTAVEQEGGDSRRWNLLVFAHCADQPRGYEIVSATSQSDSQTFKSLAAVCSPGKNAIGGGGRIDGGQGQVDLLTRPEGGGFPNRMTAAGKEDVNGFAGNWSVTAFAICATPGQLSDVTFVERFSVLDTTPLKKVIASCPSGKRLVSGAGFVDRPGHLVIIKPNTSTPTHIEVGARAASSNTDRWGLTAFAICSS